MASAVGLRADYSAAERFGVIPAALGSDSRGIPRWVSS